LHAASGHRVRHDDNQVTLLIDFADRASAEGIASDPALPEVMSEAGVVGALEMAFLEHSEQLSY
jgi:hypothetical protein